MIRLLYFAWVREGVGIDGEDLPLAESVPLSVLVDRIAARSPAHEATLASRDRLRFAINQAVATPETLVHPGDEVAIFPPVTGG